MTNWFDVDRKGLAKLIEKRGKGPLIAELIQNAWDEDVSRVEVSVRMRPGRPLADIRIEDDSPEGFADLSHAYTLFAESRKKANPEQRGRFNIGEKLVLALCHKARIQTTTGTVIFGPHGRKVLRSPRVRGTVFTAEMPMTRCEAEGVVAYLHRLIPPVGIATTINGKRLLNRHPVHEFEIALPTEIADDDGILRSRIRTTIVELYKPLDGEAAAICEMGLPVVETGDKYHANVMQKVPLNLDRNNVKPSYLKILRVAVLNETVSNLSEDEATSDWVREACSDSRCEPKSIKAIADKRFGEHRVSYDPNDWEANAHATAKGYTVVHGGMMSGGEWDNLKAADGISPAGKVFPTPKPYGDDPDATPMTLIPKVEWSAGMKAIAKYAQWMAERLIGRSIQVRMIRDKVGFSAAYGEDCLDFFVGSLGETWFNQGETVEVDALLLHEFAHHYEANHLDEAYHKVLAKLGARLKRIPVREIGK
jgi:hypothetical protein